METTQTIELTPPSWTQQIIIRTVTRADLPALEWDGEYKHFRRLYAQAFERAQLGLSRLWLAELPGRGLIGQAFVQLNCDFPELANGYDRAYLYGFRVRPAYRNCGIGSQILRTIEQNLLSNHFCWLTLNVAKQNVAAYRLYERLGFRRIGEDPGIWHYIDDQGKRHDMHEPAWRMQKRLGSGD